MKWILYLNFLCSSFLLKRKLEMCLCILAFALVIIAVSDSAEIEHSIVVDSSGSMSGFYNTGAIRMLVVNLQKILGGAKIYLFSDMGPELVDRADSLKPINRDTRMDLAIKGLMGSQLDAVWMITDNIQDRSETPYVDANTKEFYSILRMDNFARIFIMPCFLDFDGKIYLNREGRQYTESYTGKKALVIYGILLNDKHRKQFEDLSSRFAETLTGYDSKLLLAKPLDKETFDLKPSEQPSGSPPANVRLTETGVFFGKGFKEGKKIPITFYIKLLSKFDDLVVSGKVKASVIDNQFTSTGFKDSPVGCDIYPEKVSISPGKTSEEIYKITINIDKVKMKVNPVSIVRAALSGKPGRVEGIVRLEVQVPREGFTFTEEVLRRYNTEDIKDFKRIYGMGSLINYMPADVTNIPIEYKIVLAVSYPYWPLIVVILAAIAIVGIIFLIYRLLSSGRSEKFAVSVSGKEESIISFSPLFGRYNISSEGKMYGSINGNMIAKASKGFLIDGTLKSKRLNRDIDSFSIADKEGENSIDVQIRSLRETKDESSNLSDDL